MNHSAPRNLLELTKQEKRVVEQYLGVTLEQAVAVLLAAAEWAFKNTSPQDFERQFPEFVAMYKLKPAMAEVASTYVLNQVGEEEEMEADRAGFELMFLNKSEEAWGEADEQVFTAFMESCKKATEQASASLLLVCKNLYKRGMPTTKQEIENACALCSLGVGLRTIARPSRSRSERPRVMGRRSRLCGATCAVIVIRPRINLSS